MTYDLEVEALSLRVFTLTFLQHRYFPRFLVDDPTFCIELFHRLTWGGVHPSPGFRFLELFPG